MRGKIGTACMVLGTVLVLAALSLFLFNQREARQAKEYAERILPQMMEQIESKIEERAESEMADIIPELFDPAMTEVEIEGYGYVGYLSIPTLELELPVMSEWDYVRLKISPCRYTGSAKTDDLVIAGHNYPTFFGSLSQLSPGDMVYLIDMDGILYTYQVTVVEVLAPTAVEDMVAGGYDLTLFTCTYDIQNRVAVRCDRVKGE